MKSDGHRGGWVEAGILWEQNRWPLSQLGRSRASSGPVELSLLPTPMQEMNDSWFTGLKIVGVMSVPSVGPVGRANTSLHFPASSARAFVLLVTAQAPGAGVERLTPALCRLGAPLAGAQCLPA